MTKRIMAENFLSEGKKKEKSLLIIDNDNWHFHKCDPSERVAEVRCRW